jgi:hypothetical protein
MWFCGFPSSCQVKIFIFFFFFCFISLFSDILLFCCCCCLMRWSMHSSPPIHNINFFSSGFSFSLVYQHSTISKMIIFFFFFRFPDSLSFVYFFNSLFRCEIVSLSFNYFPIFLEKRREE